MTIRTAHFLSIAAAIYVGLSFLLYQAVPTIECHLDIDSTGYDALAVNFQKTTTLLDPHSPSSAPIQTVGYPFFLGILYKIFGHNYTVVILCQLLLALLCGLLIFLIAQRLCNSSVAYIAVLLTILNVGFLVYPQLLLAEIITVLFILGFFERFFLFLTSHKVLHILQAGFLLGLSVLFKPVALIYPLILAACILLFDAQPLQRKVKFIALFMLAWSMPILSYMARNYYTYDHFFLAPMAQLNIYQCFFSKVVAQIEDKTPEQAIQEKLLFKAKNSYDQTGWHDAKALFFTYLPQYPLIFAAVWLTNVIKTIGGLFSTQLKLLLNPALKGGKHSFFVGSGSLLQRTYHYICGGTDSRYLQMIALCEALWNVVRWFLVLIALLFMRKRRALLIGAVCVSFMLQSAVITGMDGCCRYRIMFEPLLIILAALGIYLIWCWVYKKEVCLRMEYS